MNNNTFDGGNIPAIIFIVFTYNDILILKSSK